jgi:hypothetical protein
MEGIMRWNSYSVALGARKLPESSMLVAMYLGTFPMRLDGTGIRVSQDTISDETGIPERTVKRAMKRLREAGVIVQVKGHNRRAPTQYVAVIPALMYGYGADEEANLRDLVGTTSDPYENPVGRPEPVDNFLVGATSDSRRCQSPSREQMNSKNTGGHLAPDWTNDRTDGQVPLAVVTPINLTVEVCPDCVFPIGHHRHDYLCLGITPPVMCEACGRAHPVDDVPVLCASAIRRAKRKAELSAQGALIAGSKAIAR